MTFGWTRSKSTNQIDFEHFYARYAPKLWGIILTANLSVSQSEQILINTLINAWQQFGQGTAYEQGTFSRLLGLAYQEGLPRDCLHESLQSNS